MAWRELLAGGAAWLAHFAWYVGRPKRRRSLPSTAAALSSALPWLPWLAVALLLVSWASWVSAHGPALGSCAALVAVTAAASTNTLLAPLSPRLSWVLAGSSFLAVLLGLGGWLAYA